MERKERKKRYYPGLDVLRIIAIVAIIGYHFYPQYLTGGFIGVDVFFVLSGFLVAGSLIARLEKGRSLDYAVFLLRRLLRLWLPLVFMVILSLGILNIIAPNFLFNVRPSLITSLTFVNNWWQIAQGSSYFAEFINPSAYTHLWYVAVQMQLYFFFPLLLALLWRIFQRKIPIAVSTLVIALISALAMAILFQPEGDPTRIYYGTDTRAFAFLLGASFGLVFNPDGLRQRIGALTSLFCDALALIGFIGLIILSRLLQDQSVSTYRGGLFLAALLALLLIAGLAGGGIIGERLLNHRWLRGLSRRTYALYLWYYPVYAVCSRLPHIQKWPLLQFVLLLFLAFVTYELMEVRLLRLFTEGRQRQPQQRTAPADNESVETFEQQKRRQLIRQRSRQMVAVLLMAIMVSAAVGFVRAPSGENKTVAEMEAQIAENQRRLEEKRQKALEVQHADVPDIPGLARRIMIASREKEVSFVGDSILLSASASLIDVFPKAQIDGKVGRQLSQSSEVVTAMEANGQLAETVVVVLGSNGPFTEAQLEAFVESLGKRQIYFVNTHVNRSWQAEVNNSLQTYCDKHKNATLIDWKSQAEQHPEWFYQDATHCNPDGAAGFANLIAKSLYRAEEDKDKKTSKSN